MTINKQLLDAVATGDLEGVTRAIEGGADVNAAEENGYTVLMGAAFYSHTKIVEKLVELGADVNAADKYGCTVLMEAARYESNKALKVLVDLGAKVNAVDKDYKITALVYAAERGNAENVAQLLELGADVKIFETDLVDRDQIEPRCANLLKAAKLTWEKAIGKGITPEDQSFLSNYNDLAEKYIKARTENIALKKAIEEILPDDENIFFNGPNYNHQVAEKYLEQRSLQVSKNLKENQKISLKILKKQQTSAELSEAERKFLENHKFDAILKDYFHPLIKAMSGATYIDNLGKESSDLLSGIFAGRGGIDNVFLEYINLEDMMVLLRYQIDDAFNKILKKGINIQSLGHLKKMFYVIALQHKTNTEERSELREAVDEIVDQMYGDIDLSHAPFTETLAAVEEVKEFSFAWPFSDFQQGIIGGNVASGLIKFADDYVTGERQEKTAYDYAAETLYKLGFSIAGMAANAAFSKVLPQGVSPVNQAILFQMLSQVALNGFKGLSPENAKDILLNTELMFYIAQSEVMELYPTTTGFVLTAGPDLLQLAYHLGHKACEMSGICNDSLQSIPLDTGVDR